MHTVIDMSVFSSQLLKGRKLQLSFMTKTEEKVWLNTFPVNWAENTYSYAIKQLQIPNHIQMKEFQAQWTSVLLQFDLGFKANHRLNGSLMWHSCYKAQCHFWD